MGTRKNNSSMHKSHAKSKLWTNQRSFGRINSNGNCFAVRNGQFYVHPMLDPHSPRAWKCMAYNSIVPPENQNPFRSRIRMLARTEYHELKVGLVGAAAILKDLKKHDLQQA